jgi:hypothetical protein
MEPGAAASDMATLACQKTGQAADPGKITESAACGHSMKNRG